MKLDRRRFTLLGASTLASGCSITANKESKLGFSSPPPLAPLKLSLNALTRITVCTRPFRPAGPRLEAVSYDGKKVVHNYGHGGSGWSLSWGCADEAAKLALANSPKQIAVIGAGVIGMTTALRLIEHGIPVTIYANESPRRHALPGRPAYGRPAAALG